MPFPIFPFPGLTQVHPFIILLKAVDLSPAFSRGPKRKSVYYKLTMAGHHPRSPASWTLALHSPSGTLSPPGPITAPSLTACSSQAQSLESLISLPTCQSSAVLRIILFHIVGGEPANLERDREVVREASARSPTVPRHTRKVPSYLRAFAPAIPSTPESTSPRYTLG